MPDQHRDADVVVVGQGPVGQTLALLLGHAGHRVAAFDAKPAPYPLPRAVHFDHEIGRIFQSAGVGRQVQAITDPVPDFYEWRDRQERALLRIDWSGTGPSGWPVANFFSQPELETVLSTAIDAMPTTIGVRRGAHVHNITTSPDAVTTRWKDTDGTEHSITSRYVIGCDGANSFVPRHHEHRRTRPRLPLRLAHRRRDPETRQVWSPMNWQLCDPARPTTIVSGGPRRRRWEFMRLPGETRTDQRDDLQCPKPDRAALGDPTAAARRCDLHRHTLRRRDWPSATTVADGRR